MSDEGIKSAAEIAKAVKGIVESVPIYQDAIQPVAKQVGTTLETVGKAVNTALFPINALIWGADQIKDFVQTKVAEKLKDVPPENIIPPKPNVGGPAIEALRFTGHEEALSDLYANLLATAMNRETASGAHPAFVEIIKQLTPDEAKLLVLFTSGVPLPIINIRWEYKNPSSEKSGGMDVMNYFSHLGLIASCEYSELTPTYIDNLCRLGLAEIPEFYQFTGVGVYDSIENDESVKKLTSQIESNPELKAVIDRKGIRVTPMGQQFVKSCTRH